MGDNMKEKKVKKGKKISLETKQLYWIIGVMTALILLFILISAGIQSTKNFDYYGLAFTKEKFGEIPVYHYYRFYESGDGQTIKHNLYLRTDPRKNDVPIQGGIAFPKDSEVYISINSTG